MKVKRERPRDKKWFFHCLLSLGLFVSFSFLESHAYLFPFKTKRGDAAIPREKKRINNPKTRREKIDA